MYRVTTGLEPENGILDVDMRETSAWREPPFSGGVRDLAAILLGDEQTGPFAALYSNPPLDAPTPATPGHGHGSDSWRIALLGQMRVGAQHYMAGAFRFQEGGAIYGADDSPWGPEGGCSVVMIGDRRGASAIPAYPENLEKFRRSGEVFNAWLGMPPRAAFSAPQFVATTLGMPRNGRVNGSFVDEWPEIRPGVQFAAGILGDRESGPIVILTKAEPGRVAFPALTISSDIMHIVASGATAGERPLAAYQVRLIGADVPGDRFIAGEAPLWLASVIGDRRAWAGQRMEDTEWMGAVQDQVGALLEMAAQKSTA